jgi:threonine aldolase
MANQIGVNVSTKAGDEIIVERDAHIFQHETAAASFISRVQINTLRGDHGVLTVGQIESAVRPDIYYMPRTALICLENTHNKAGGTIYPLDEIERIARWARRKKIALHLDGARLWNASAALGIAPEKIARHFDTVSVCFSKGLGAPVGSAIAGSKETIAKAKKMRKILGGGMRQAGVIAAGAIFALDHHLTRLKDDHEKARRLAASMSGLGSVAIDMRWVQTNIVLIDVSQSGRNSAEWIAVLRGKGVLVSDMGPTALRAVTHLDVSFEDIERASVIMRHCFEKR